MSSERLASNSAKLYPGAKYLLLITGVIFIFCTKSVINLSHSFKERLGRNHNIKIHQRGYWSGRDAEEYHTYNHAAGLSKRLVTFFRREGAKSVIDFGGGNGHQVQNLIQNGIFATCYDGNPDAQDVSDGICGTMDLTKPLNLAQYDWVLSLSVGRQIPTKYEKDFLANIDRVNKKGVVIYWGDGKPTKIPRRISVRDNTQVIQTFINMGYTNDKVAQNYLRGNVPPKNYSVLVFRKGSTSKGKTTQGHVVVKTGKPLLNLAVVSCGTSKLEETVTMVKSAIMFSHGSRLKLYAFTDNETLQKFSQYMELLRKESMEADTEFVFDYELKVASFPEEMDGVTSWARMFKPCSLQRLFLPSVLPKVDSVMYMEPDTVIMSNMTHMWNQFHYMNSTQFIGLSQDEESQGMIYGTSLMNLTKMREVKFEEKIYEVLKKPEYFEPRITSDRFLQNILYSEHPEFVYVLPCDWNLLYAHCTCDLHDVCGACSSTLQNGVAMIHGTNDAFTNRTRIPLFRHIYQHFKAYSIKTDNLTSLTTKLQNQFNLEQNFCSFDSSKEFYKRMNTYVNTLMEW